MSKPTFLKTSFWKKKIKQFIIQLFLVDFIFYKHKKTNNLLVITLDALGDNVVKSKTIKLLEKKFGQDNTYILCKSKWKSIYKLQNYKHIFIDETKWNVFYKIKLYRKLNKIGFNTVVILNHSYLPEEEKFILTGKKYDTSQTVDYILNKHLFLLNKILDRKVIINDIIPDMRVYFPETKYHNIITLAVGTADYIKTPTFNNLCKYIEGILSLNLNKDIYLLGTGDKQNTVATEIINSINSKKIKNMVDKLDLIEVMQMIKDSDLFIGGDSGLYNIAFCLKTKTICLHWKDNYPLWEHRTENIKILKGKGGKEYVDKQYGTDILNSITFEQIKEAMEELNVN